MSDNARVARELLFQGGGSNVLPLEVRIRQALDARDRAHAEEVKKWREECERERKMIGALHVEADRLEDEVERLRGERDDAQEAVAHLQNANTQARADLAKVERSLELLDPHGVAADWEDASDIAIKVRDACIEAVRTTLRDLGTEDA